jgi:putative membrane protein insertion efficiency factor
LAREAEEVRVTVPAAAGKGVTASAKTGVTPPARTGVVFGVARDVLRGVWSLPSLAVLGLVRVYQLTLSPMLGPACRFHPSCSHYACACLRDHGLVWGGALTVRRIVRCQPFCVGGFDPPPPPRAHSLWARFVLRASAAQDTSVVQRGASVHAADTSPRDRESAADEVVPAASGDAGRAALPPGPMPNDLLRGVP